MDRERQRKERHLAEVHIWALWRDAKTAANIEDGTYAAQEIGLAIRRAYELGRRLTWEEQRRDSLATLMGRVRVEMPTSTPPAAPEARSEG